MAIDEPRPFVSVTLGPATRRQRFLLPEAGFDPPLAPGEDVVVSTGRAQVVGCVSAAIPGLDARPAPAPAAGQVVRRPSAEDAARRLSQQRREREAYRVGVLKIRERGLEMKLVRVEQQFDRPRLVFVFTAEARVDFRQLVRELAAEFRCWIEMRQIGARDEARLLGGYGTCGRPLCCTTWLRSFEPISIKMAKRQHLSLSPSRLSGLCGRLKCCLRYELPNAAGESFAGCAHEGGCSRSGGCGRAAGHATCSGCAPS